MILVGPVGPLTPWLARQDTARALTTAPAQRLALRAELSSIAPAGGASLVVDGRGAPAGLLAGIEEFCLWAERRSMRPRVLLLSDAGVYGAPAAGIAVREEATATDLPGEARALLDLEGELAGRASRRGFELVVARLFEVIEPTPGAAPIADLAERVRSASLGSLPALGLSRDYLDARDAARILAALCTVPDPGRAVVNVCSGIAVTGRELACAVIELVRPAQADALKATLEGPPDHRPPWLVGNPARLLALLGALSRRPLLETIKAVYPWAPIP